MALGFCTGWIKEREKQQKKQKKQREYFKTSRTICRESCDKVLEKEKVLAFFSVFLIMASFVKLNTNPILFVFDWIYIEAVRKTNVSTSASS